MHRQVHAHEAHRRLPGGLLRGPNCRFGIREFGMGAVSNAGSRHKLSLAPHFATSTIFVLSFTEGVCRRYEAYGWQVLTVGR